MNKPPGQRISSPHRRRDAAAIRRAGDHIAGGFFASALYSSAERLPLWSVSAASNCACVSFGQTFCASANDILASRSVSASIKLGGGPAGAAAAAGGGAG